MDENPLPSDASSGEQPQEPTPNLPKPRKHRRGRKKGVLPTFIPPSQGGQPLYTEEEVKQALIECHGHYTLTAQKLGISTYTLLNYRKRHPALQEIAKMTRRARVEHVIDALFDNALGGDVRAQRLVIFGSPEGRQMGWRLHKETVQQPKVDNVYINQVQITEDKKQAFLDAWKARYQDESTQPPMPDKSPNGLKELKELPAPEQNLPTVINQEGNVQELDKGGST